jgi:hypothetical protein
MAARGLIADNGLKQGVNPQVSVTNLCCVAYPESVLFRHGKVGAA